MPGRGAFCPGAELRAGLLQHPLPDGQDEPGRLGNGDELRRGHLAVQRVLPAQQNLGAQHMPCLVDLCLEVQGQLARWDGVAQSRFQGGLVFQPGLQGGSNRQ